MKGPINVLLKKGDYYYVTQKWKYWQLCYVPAVYALIYPYLIPLRQLTQLLFFLSPVSL